MGTEYVEEKKWASFGRSYANSTNHANRLIVTGGCLDLWNYKAGAWPLDLRNGYLPFRKESCFPLRTWFEKEVRYASGIKQKACPLQNGRSLRFRATRFSQGETVKSGKPFPGSNRKGFALVSMMIALPLLLSTAFATSAVSLLLVEKSRKLHGCRTSVLRLQKSLGDSLKQLLKLNPKARKLQIKRTRAVIRLKSALATGNAAVVAAMKAELAFITAEQIRLAALQNSWLASSEQTWTKWKTTQVGTAKRNWPAALAVIAEKPSLAPVYKTVLSFRRSQTVYLQGLSPVPGNQFLPEGLRLSKLQWSCAGSLHANQKQSSQEVSWHPRLVAAK